MLLTNKVEYALLFLVELASVSRLAPGAAASVPTREVASRQRLPAKLVPQLVSRLRSRGWLETARGPGGGVRLRTSPEAISVAEVVEAVEGRPYVKGCLSPASGCPREALCPLQEVWYRAQQALDEVLRRTTVADLVKAQANRTASTVRHRSGVRRRGGPGGGPAGDHRREWLRALRGRGGKPVGPRRAGP